MVYYILIMIKCFYDKDDMVIKDDVYIFLVMKRFDLKLVEGKYWIR